MNIRLKSLLSEILVLALAFSMTMPVSAAPYNQLKGEVSLLNGDEDEIDVNPGEVGSLGGWAVTEKNNKFRVYRSKNGDFFSFDTPSINISLIYQILALSSGAIYILLPSGMSKAS